MSYLAAGLDRIAAKYPAICNDRRGIGFMQGIDLKIPPCLAASKCMDNGLLVCSAGYTVLRIIPPLIVGRKEIDEALAIIDKALSEL
ncbi:MAG: aminotransferase class III-fold pyridoxal phosphate-dependent enzyme [Candidatus Ornithospirochaeta sp.]|nr:aminotransferase class III-fold pyridoxal phosphate-dependent enzyme [Candidatus Ornithospirochaeta sp.]